jgi:hypothetical protein
VPTKLAGPLGRVLGRFIRCVRAGVSWAAGLQPGSLGGYQILFFNLFNIYSLNMIQIQVQTLNDYSSQNKIQEHFITQENMQRHEMQQIIIYLYK